MLRVHRQHASAFMSGWTYLIPQEGRRCGNCAGLRNTSSMIPAIRRWSKQFLQGADRAIWKIKEFLPAWAPESRCDAQPYMVGFFGRCARLSGFSPPVISCNSFFMLI